MNRSRIGLLVILVAGATLALANPAIQAEARKRQPERDFKCGTCHERLPNRLNGYALALTEEGKRWRMPEESKKDSGCTLQ